MWRVAGILSLAFAPLPIISFILRRLQSTGRRVDES